MDTINNYADALGHQIVVKSGKASDMRTALTRMEEELRALRRMHTQIEGIQDRFRYELCSECGKDIEDHALIVDPLGNMHAGCLYLDDMGAGDLQLTLRNVYGMDPGKIARVTQDIATILDHNGSMTFIARVGGEERTIRITRTVEDGVTTYATTKEEK